jgi:hypothetical protein
MGSDTFALKGLHYSTRGKALYGNEHVDFLPQKSPLQNPPTADGYDDITPPITLLTQDPLYKNANPALYCAIYLFGNDVISV